MNEILTLDEVKLRFDSEWVLFGDVEQNDRHEILRGRVLFHSKDRDEMYRKLIELKPQRGATYYTGSMPAGTDILL